MIFIEMGFKQAMLQSNQELIDQFNRDEQRWQRLRCRKVKRRVRLSKLGALSHAMLDRRDELRQKRRPAECVGRGQYSISDPLFAEYVKRQKPK